MSGCACTQGMKTVLVYGCSGAANVAEVSDLAARRLAREGDGAMYCLAGLGAQISGMIEVARQATVNLVIDGCPQNCAKKIFDRAGLTNYVTLQVTDLGIEKQKGAAATPGQVDRVVARARELISQA